MTAPTPPAVDTPLVPRLRPGTRVAFVALVISAIAAALLQLQSNAFAFDQPGMIVILALGFAAAERTVFHVEAREQAISYTPAEIVLAIALLFLAPLEIVVARMVGTILGMIVVRRLPPIKLAFNAALLTFESIIAVTVFAGLRSWLGHGLTPTWASLILALTISFVSGGVVVAVVIAQYEGDLLDRVRRELGTAHLLYLPTILYGASVAVPLAVDPRLGLVALAPAPVVWFMLRSHGRLLHRFTDLSSVHAFSRKVGDAPDLPAMVQTAIDQISKHLRADLVAIRLWSDEVTTIEATAGDVCLDSLPGPGPGNDPAWADILSSRHVHRIADLPSEIGAGLEAAGFGQGLISPLIDEEGSLGVVAIAARNGVTSEFDDDDASRLNGLAQQLAVAVRKGYLHEMITFEATHDRLTQLPNRSFLESQIDQSDSREPAAVLLIDLDRFKLINDAFGHHAGDQLLIEAARRIRVASEQYEAVARFGGDEFAVFAPGLDREEAHLLAETIGSALEEAFDIGAASVAIGASIGIALRPEHGLDATKLLRRADIAMYDAKARRIRSSAYRGELEVDTADRLTLLDDLRSALRNGEVEVHFQPQVDVDTRDVTGVEALARWEHPVRGRVGPDVFVPLAEQAGLIEQLTDQVLRLATSAAADWHKGGKFLNVSVNISAQSLLDERLETIVADALIASSIDPAYLTLEITESTVMSDGGQTTRVLQGLADLGIRLSVDDFGTGFSSLVNLRNLAVDEVKIDRSFVMDMMTAHDDEVIVRSTIDLAHNLGLAVVAEGVESEAILERLTELGCDIAQGYGISRPLPRHLLDVWLADQRISRPRDTSAEIEVTQSP